MPRFAGRRGIGLYWAAATSGSVVLLLTWLGGTNSAVGAFVSAAESPSTGSFVNPIKRTCHRTGSESPRIAIIGGGIGGTSSAYFLRQLFGPAARIDLYDIQGIGGRTSTINIAGREYDSGASIIHPSNKYLLEFVEQFGLSKRVKPASTSGFYDGEKFVLTESEWGVVTLGKLLWRYGYDFIRLFRDVDAWIKQFERIYALQDNGQAFNTVEGLVEAMGGNDFVKATMDPLIPRLKAHGYSDRFISEIVAAATRVNYGQFEDINAFAGMVSLAGVQPGLWSVHGGNTKLSEALFQESQARHHKSLVMSVECNSTASKLGDVFRLHFIPWEPNYAELKLKAKDSADYDIVILAAPQHGKPPKQHPINFAGFGSQSRTPSGAFAGQYKRTVSNFVNGTPNAETFGTDSANSLPDGIMTIVEPKLRFRSMTKNFPVDISPEEAKAKDTYAYKVFATEPLDEEQLKALFAEYSEVAYVDWLAYPHYGTIDKIPPFELHPGVYYVNGIEWAASALEMSVIGSRNVALLAHQYWTCQGSNARDDSKLLADKDEL